MEDGQGVIAELGEMRSYVADLWIADEQILTDEPRLRMSLHSAAGAGGATILGELFHIFPNGAVTGMLLLAQSHLCIHTWPELGLANVDLLGYGSLKGDLILDSLCESLTPTRSSRLAVVRGRY